MTEQYDRALAPSGLKITMFRVLRRLSDAGSPTITELAELVELDRSSLSRNLKILQRDGVVYFKGSDDERSKVVQLTPAGKAALKKALPLWLKVQARMKLEIGEEQDFDLGHHVENKPCQGCVLTYRDQPPSSPDNGTKVKLMHSVFLPRAFARLDIHYGWAVVGVIFLTMLSTSVKRMVDRAEGLFLRSGSPQNIYLLPQHPNFHLKRCP